MLTSIGCDNLKHKTGSSVFPKITTTEKVFQTHEIHLGQVCLNHAVGMALIKDFLLHTAPEWEQVAGQRERGG